MIVSAFLIAAAPWFGLSVGGARPKCVELAYVQPNSPSASAGLRSGDCVTAIDGKSVRDTDGVATTLRRTMPWSSVRFTLATGRRVMVTPIERTEELERGYCEYLRSLRTEIRVPIVGNDQPIELSLPPPVTLGALRKRLNAPSTVRVTARDKCAKTEPLTTDDPPDGFIIPDGAMLIFGYENARIFRLPQVQVDSAAELWPDGRADGGKSAQPTENPGERH